jgi:hypothetical protein
MTFEAVLEDLADERALFGRLRGRGLRCLRRLRGELNGREHRQRDKDGTKTSAK